MKLRRPHVVPRGYLRNFAAGEQLLLVDKATRHARPVGTRDCFVRRGFLTVDLGDRRIDHLEDQFAEIETWTLPAVRQMRAHVPRTDRQQQAIKTLMAMLWARSFALDVVMERILAATTADIVDTVANDPDIRAEHEADIGRPAEPGELERIAFARADRLRTSRIEAVNAMIRSHNHAGTKFSELHVAVYEPVSSTEFVTSDNPVLLASDSQMIHVGTHNGLALGDAGFVFLPISRRVAVCLTSEPEPDFTLSVADTVRMNNATWRNAVARIAAHPTANWSSLCGVSNRPGRTPHHPPPAP